MPDLQTMQLYCVADRRHYETPARLPDAAGRHPLADAPPPGGWRRAGQGLWTVLLPEGHRMPDQGWKIHLAAVPEEAADTLRVAAAICLAAGVPFKFLRSEAALRLMSATHAPRAGSGKFVTVYPPDEARFGKLVEELSAALAGRRGPYLLSDLRIGDGPVHVRYGAFTLRQRPGADGLPRPVLRGPDGAWEPDERRPVFRVPPWVPVPDVLVPHLAARDATTVPGPPYVVRQALHFTNAGGVYLADDPRTGGRVVLREARAHSGLDRFGADAPTRLRREHAALRRLAGLPCVPRVFGLHEVWEHLYLAEEHVEGEPLLHAVIARNPLVRAGHTAADLAAYARWVDDVTGRVGAALDAVHGRGLAFGDLHPGNVLLRPDGSVALVDFEYAADLDDPAAPRPGAAGHTPPAGLTGAEADRYALDMLRLALLMPMAELRERHPAKAATLARLAGDRYPLPAPPAPGEPADGAAEADERAVRALFGVPGDDAGWLTERPARPDWPALRRALTAGVRAAATPGRPDRLFPGGPEVFVHGGHTLAHGAAGVLAALHRVGEEVPGEWTAWLRDAARRADAAAGGGLLHGPHGTAWVLADLGHPDAAHEVLERAGAAEDASPAVGLASGAAGIGLARLRLGDERGALRVATRLAREAAQPEDAGLLRGMTGPALLHLALHRVTGDAGWLRAARAALAADLARCVTLPDGTVHVRRSGDRHLLYLGMGSAGIALAVRAYQAASGDDDPELAAFVAGVRRGCGTLFVREPGLLQGRAGLAAALAGLGAPPAETTAQAARVAWHAVHERGALLVPGAHLLRFSADLATGSAGVLLALRAALTGVPATPLALLGLA